jgi:hypothetical protein
MRHFLFIVAAILVGVSQDSIPQKHTEATHPDQHSEKATDYSKPGAQIVYVEASGTNKDVDTKFKTSTSQQPPEWWQRPTVTDWILAVTTLCYLGVNIFMLRAIKRQSTATMDADCALILILWQNMVHIDPEAPNGVLHHCFNWTFKNVGKTPAFIQNVHSRYSRRKTLRSSSQSDLPETERNVLRIRTSAHQSIVHS